MTGKPTKVTSNLQTNLEHVMHRHGPSGLAASRGQRHVHANLGLRIDRDGIWYYHGSPIARKELVCLFASVLHRDEDGHYWLITPAEIGEIEVEDAPFIAVEMFVSGDGDDRTISLRTNVDEIVTVDPEHPLFVITDPVTGEPSPYVRLDRNLTARVCRAVYYDLVALGTERTVDGGRVLGVSSGNAFFELGALEEA